jgi:hypothetical protein
VRSYSDFEFVCLTLLCFCHPTSLVRRLLAHGIIYRLAHNMPSRKRSEKPALRTQPASVSSTSAVGRAPSSPAARGRAIQHDSPLATMARNRPRSYHTNLAIRGESLPATPTKAPGQLSRPGFSIFLDDSADDSLFASQSPSAARPIAGINALNKRQNKKENPIPRDQRSRRSVNAGKSLGELSAYTHVHRKSPGLQGRTLLLGSKTPDPNTSLAMVSSKAGLPGTATDKISQKDPQLLHKRVSTSASTNYSTHLPQHAQEVEVVPPTISALPRSPHETDIVNPTPPWISSQSSTNRSPAQHSYVHPPLRHVSRSNVFSSSFSPTFADRLLADLTTPTRRHVFSPLAASTPKFLKRWRASNDAVAHESDDMEIDMSPSPTQSRKRRKVNRASGDSLFSSLGNTTRSHNTASSWTSSAVLASLRARSNTSMSKESDMSLSSVVEPTGPLPHGASDNGSHDITDTPRLSALKPALSRSSRLSAPGVSSFSISASLRPSTRLTHSASTGPQSSTSRQTGMTDSLFSASGAGTLIIHFSACGRVDGSYRYH